MLWKISTMATVHVWCILFLLITHGQLTRAQCVTGVNCFLPDCMCLGNSPPSGLDFKTIPQMVLFTFDDAVRRLELAFYNRLFSATRLNPNDCPISMTLFVQDKDTEYDVVRNLYERGMEMAVHSVTHRSPQSDWKIMSKTELQHEIYTQKLNLNQKAGIPLDKVRGWRSPYLQPTGNTQFEILSDKKHGFFYDSSLVREKRILAQEGVWPFTLDHGFSLFCGSPPCPTKQYPGLWEFLITPMVDNEQFPRIYVDAYRPDNVNSSYTYLMQNFLSYYQGNRAPFMVNMHASWFTSNHNLEAMDKFIQTLVGYSDVYILTIQQALEWIKSPVDLNSSLHFVPWKCEPIKAGTFSAVKTFTRQRPPTTGMYIPPPTPSPCIQGLNCKLPNCLCPDNGPPRNIAKENTPQIVLFTFDGSVNRKNYKFYNKLFSNLRKNPNGSPLTMSFFVSDEETDYGLVKLLHDQDMEIAVQGSRQTLSLEFWKYASVNEFRDLVVEQRSRIAEKANIPLSSIRGWRSPYLQPSGDNQYRVLTQNDFLYDSTLCGSAAIDDTIGWPFTLDYGWTKVCVIEPCPKEKYPGHWVVPVLTMLDVVDGLPCRYVDSCLPSNKTDALEYLWKNFNNFYLGEKAPFMVNIHSSSFERNSMYFDVIDEFTRQLTRLDDVYFVTIQQSLEWLKQPTGLTALESFSPWLHKVHKSTIDSGIRPTGVNSSQIPENKIETEKPDWVMAVLIVVAALFCACLILTVTMYFVKKHQMRKRDNEVKKAVTLASDRNSVTDWLDNFPRRPSQLSCSNLDTFTSQSDGLDNMAFRTDTDDSTNTHPKKLVVTSDSLTLNPDLLENNKSRDLQIWNKQERKIPHILNKSKKREKLKNVKGLSVEAIEKQGKNNETGRKPWAFVWDPCKSQSHSESVFNSKLDKDSRNENSIISSHDKPSRSSLGSGDLNSSSGIYRSYCSDSVENDELSISELNSKLSDKVVYQKDSKSQHALVNHQPVDRSQTLNQRNKGIPKCKRKSSSTDSNDHIYTSSRHEHISKTQSPTKDSNQRCNKRKQDENKGEKRKDFVGDKNFKLESESMAVSGINSCDSIITYCDREPQVRHNNCNLTNEYEISTVGKMDKSQTYSRDPRVTKEMEEEWERDVLKEMDKFLKSKHSLKGLDLYR